MRENLSSGFTNIEGADQRSSAKSDQPLCHLLIEKVSYLDMLQAKFQLSSCITAHMITELDIDNLLLDDTEPVVFLFFHNNKIVQINLSRATYYLQQTTFSNFVAFSNKVNRA